MKGVVGRSHGTKKKGLEGESNAEIDRSPVETTCWGHGESRMAIFDKTTGHRRPVRLESLSYTEGLVVAEVRHGVC